MRLDANHEFISAKAIIAKANDFIVNKYQYYLDDETHESIKIPVKKQTELVIHMIEVVDSTFIEPAKSVFLSHIPGFAQIVAEDELWANLITLPKENNAILNSALVLLCD